MNKPIIRVTCEKAAGLTLLYAYYSNEFAARQQDLNEDGSLVVDYAADGSIVGIELISPAPGDLQIVERFAQENDLSLEGLFSHAT